MEENDTHLTIKVKHKMEFLLVFDYDRTIYLSTDKTYTTVKQTEDGIKLAFLKVILDIRDKDRNRFSRGFDHLLFNLDDDSDNEKKQIQEYFGDKKNSYKNFYEELFREEKFNYEKALESRHLKMADVIAKIFKKVAKEDNECEFTYKNHWCYGPMHKDGFGASLKSIEENFRKMALVERYNNSIEANKEIEKLMRDWKDMGYKILSYTDNCKENVFEGLASLIEREEIKDFDLDDFEVIDMFDTGGFNKKTEKGILIFLDIVKKRFGIDDPSKIVLFDDNEEIVRNALKYGIRVCHVDNDGIREVVKEKSGEWIKKEISKDKSNSFLGFFK